MSLDATLAEPVAARCVLGGVVTGLPGAVGSGPGAIDFVEPPEPVVILALLEASNPARTLVVTGGPANVQIAGQVTIAGTTGGTYDGTFTVIAVHAPNVFLMQVPYVADDFTGTATPA